MSYTSLFSSSDPYSIVREDEILIGVPGSTQEDFEIEQVGRSLFVKYLPKEEGSFLSGRSWRYLLRGQQEVLAQFKNGLLRLRLESEAPTRIPIEAA